MTEHSSWFLKDKQTCIFIGIVGTCIVGIKQNCHLSGLDYYQTQCKVLTRMTSLNPYKYSNK